MAEAIGELIVAIGDAVAKDSDFLNKKSKTKSRIIHALYYLIPMGILCGLYFYVTNWLFVLIEWLVPEGIIFPRKAYCNA